MRRILPYPVLSLGLFVASILLSASVAPPALALAVLLALLAPIIMLALIAYSVVANLGMRLLGTMPSPDLPLWINLTTWPAMIVSGVIYVASLQGAMLLHRLKQEA